MPNPVPPAVPGGEPTRRLFLALWPDEATRRALAQHQAEWPWQPGARPVTVERLHLTLHFLGEVAPHRVPSLAEALRALPAPSLELDAAGAECWRGGLAVLLLKPSDALLALHADCARCLQQLGFATERRPYRPHVTLARRAGASQPPPHAGPRWRSHGFSLVASMRAPVPSYRILMQCDSAG